MIETTYYELNKYEGSDIFNPIAVENPNADIIDGQMHQNELNSVGTATEVLSGTVHAIVRALPDTAMFRFVATSDFTFGDSFTVDGISYTAKMSDGSQMNTGAFVTGANVLCCLEGSELTFFVASTGTAPDSDRLGGELPSHYATASDLADAVSDISDNAQDISDIQTALTGIITGTLSAGATTVTLIDARIKVTSIVEPYQYVPNGVDTEIIAPTKINVSSGQCTLTFDAQSTAVTVGVRVIG